MFVIIAAVIIKNLLRKSMYDIKNAKCRISVSNAIKIKIDKSKQA